MAATAPNLTYRYKVSYTGPFGTHTMLFHFQGTPTIVEMRTAVAAIVTALSGLTWNTTTFDKAELSAAGSDFFSLDTGWTAITRTSATNPFASSAPSHFAQFGGRTPTTGKRAKWYLFEDTLGDNDNMRFTRAENADVDAVLDALEAQIDVISAIDGNGLAFYNYANVGQNDHLTHKARS